MLALNTMMSAKKILKLSEAENRKASEKGLLVLCHEICGERVHKNFGMMIEKHLATYFNFERASILSIKNGKVFELRDVLTGSIGGALSGLTGKCIAEQRVIISPYGEKDRLYNSDIDNIMSVKSFKNIMVIPLMIESEVIGVLQLVNYNGNIAKLRNV